MTGRPNAAQSGSGKQTDGNRHRTRRRASVSAGSGATERPEGLPQPDRDAGQLIETLPPNEPALDEQQTFLCWLAGEFDAGPEGLASTSPAEISPRERLVILDAVSRTTLPPGVAETLVRTLSR